MIGYPRRREANKRSATTTFYPHARGIIVDNFLSIVKERRTIRRFLPREIPAELVGKLLEAVQMTPSWGNSQCWEVILIDRPELKESLQQTLLPRNPASLAIVGAPLLIALCGKKQLSGYYQGGATTELGDWLLFDLGLACQNLCLTAHAHGLGSAVVGAFDHRRAAALLAVPEEYELVALLPIGYPDQDPPPPRRRAVTDFTHRNGF